MTDEFLTILPQLVDFIVAHRDETTLLLQAAEGTRYAHFMEELQDLDVNVGESNIQKAFGNKPIGEKTYRIMMSGYFSMLKEVFLSDATREDMISMVTDIQTMYQNGIMALLNAAKEQYNGKEESV